MPRRQLAKLPETTGKRASSGRHAAKKSMPFDGHLIIDGASTATIVIGRDSRIVHFGAAAQRLFKYDAADAIGIDIGQLLPKIGEIIALDNSDEIALHWRRIGGQTRLGRALALKVCVRPITWRRRHYHVISVDNAAPENRMRRRLRASEIQLAKIVELSDDAIVSVDLNGTITLFSDGAERMFGYTADEIVGRSLDLLIPKNARGAHRARIAAFVTGKGNTRHMGQRGEILARRKNGDVFPTEASIMHFDLAGETVLTAIMRDITERKRHEQALNDAKRQAESANRAKSGFLANMSHELRTPLNAIIGFAEVMQRETLGPLGSPRYLSYCADIRNAGLHLLSVINDVLDVSKIEAGGMIANLAPLDIAAAVTGATRMVRERLEAAGLALNVNIAGNLPLLKADERLLKQMLLNLLSNAIKFTPAGGITVRAYLAADGGLVIAVADTGIGMAPADIPRALQAFGQIDSAITRKFGGTGLGLHLVRSMAALQGGALQLESNVGAGTTAKLIFPATQVLKTQHAEALIDSCS